MNVTVQLTIHVSRCVSILKVATTVLAIKAINTLKTVIPIVQVRCDMIDYVPRY